MRKRMISPEIWGDPSFAQLSHSARLLWIGMFSIADDMGYGRGDAGSFKRLIFGFDDIAFSNVAQYLEEIKEKMKNVHFFKADNNEEYYHLLKWSATQSQRTERIQPSIYPVCDICLTSVRQMSAQVKLREGKLITPHSPPFFSSTATEKKGERKFENFHDDDERRTTNVIPVNASDMERTKLLKDNLRKLMGKVP